MSQLRSVPIPREVAPEDLIPGRTYKVLFDDCCLIGWFIDTFVGWQGDDAVFEMAAIEGPAQYLQVGS